MKLSAPKRVTWWVSLVLGVAGLVVYFTGTNLQLGVVLLALGLALLLLATAVKGL